MSLVQLRGDPVKVGPLHAGGSSVGLLPHLVLDVGKLLPLVILLAVTVTVPDTDAVSAVLGSRSQGLLDLR